MSLDVAKEINIIDIFRIKNKIREMEAKPSSQILEFNIIADERYLEIKEKIGLAPVDYLYEIKKIYSGDGQKIMYRHIFIAFDRFPEIKLDEEIIPLLSGKYNFVGGVFKSKARAALVDKNDHRYLDAEIHDAAANDPLQQELMTAETSGVSIRFWTLDKTISTISKASPRQHIFLVVKTPEDVLKLVKGGVPIKSVNVGNMHFSEGKERIYKKVFVNEEDKNAFNELIDAGVECYIQDVPEDKRDVLSKF